MWTKFTLHRIILHYSVSIIHLFLFLESPGTVGESMSMSVTSASILGTISASSV